MEMLGVGTASLEKWIDAETAVDVLRVADLKRNDYTTVLELLPQEVRYDALHGQVRCLHHPMYPGHSQEPDDHGLLSTLEANSERTEGQSSGQFQCLAKARLARLSMETRQWVDLFVL